MSTDALFDLDPAQVRMDELSNLSAQRRLTKRQRIALERGQHPLSIVCGHMPLHDQAAPADDLKADGRRCRDCVFHRGWGAHSFPKCLYEGARVSHGAATDLCAWWPGCRDHQYESETTDA